MNAIDRTRNRASALLAIGLACALASGGCGEKEASQTRRDSSAAPRAPAPLPDPEAAGISNLARISRYVFGEMTRRGGECRVASLPQDYEYAIEVTVAGGRVSQARLVAARPAGAGSGTALPEEEWPTPLSQLVDCLRPHLVAMPMPQPPADGVYETRFRVPGSAGPEVARNRIPGSGGTPAGETLPDPTEPNLPDLVRVARYTFRVIRTTQGPCSFQNPMREPLTYVLEIEVKGGAVARSRLAGARLEHPAAPLPLTEENWPATLVEYAGCLAPRLQAMEMSPAPRDGVYRTEYTSPGSPGTAPFP